MPPAHLTPDPARSRGRAAPHTGRAPSAAVLVAAAAVVAATATGERAARAEFDPGLFTGAHLFAEGTRIGRAPTGDAAAVPEHMAAAGLRLAWVPVPRAALEAEAAVIPTWSRAAGAPRATVVGYGASLRVNLLTGRLRPFLLAGVGAQTLFSGDARVLEGGTLPLVQAGGGLEVDLGERIGLRLDGRAQFVAALGSAPFATDGEVLLGLYLRLDRPAAAATASPSVAAVPVAATSPCGEVRCPEAPPCPPCETPRAVAAAAPTTAAAAASGPPIPDELAAPDPDGDGDLDGTPNRADRCPARPGPADNRGCPDVDTDGDEVVDRLDQCPDLPESDNGWQDADGCPDELPEDLRPFVGVVRAIGFRASSTELMRESLPVLDELANVLHGRPSLRMEIAAYTDASGSAERNTRMSQQRADAVRDYLMTRGIAASRLVAVGYGPGRPIQTNETLEGRNANRRVELHLVR